MTTRNQKPEWYSRLTPEAKADYDAWLADGAPSFLDDDEGGAQPAVTSRAGSTGPVCEDWDERLTTETERRDKWTPGELRVLAVVARSEGWAWAEKHAHRILDEARAFEGDDLEQYV